MKVALGRSVTPAAALAVKSGEVPPWVFALLGAAAEVAAAAEGAGFRPDEKSGFGLRRIDGSEATLWSLRVADAEELGAEAFEASCAAAYRELGGRVRSSERPHAVRWWNFIPGILEPLGGLEHRYMVFNAGRYQALAAAGSTGFGRLATASGVGLEGRDFVLHCLSTAEPGVQVENPRQIPAWRYSSRFGPKPPCFARATRVTPSGRPWLLVGGTASVRGEESFHPGDLRGQLEETLRNLAALVHAAEWSLAGRGGRPAPEAGEGSGATPVLAFAETDAWLARYRELRVYHPRPGDAGEIAAELRRRFGPAVAIEMVPAELCRPELLVEIEGLARLETVG